MSRAEKNELLDRYMGAENGFEINSAERDLLVEVLEEMIPKFQGLLARLQDDAAKEEAGR